MLWRRLRRNCASKNSTIGLTSSAPKSGNILLTGRNSGSCIRDKVSMIIRTTGCQGFIILNAISHPVARYASKVQIYRLIIWSISIINAYMKACSVWFCFNYAIGSRLFEEALYSKQFNDDNICFALLRCIFPKTVPSKGEVFVFDPTSPLSTKGLRTRKMLEISDLNAYHLTNETTYV